MKMSKFFFQLVKEIKYDEVGFVANQLTYKLLLSFFPCLIFIMTLIGFFELKIDLTKFHYLPEDILNVILNFDKEVIQTRNAGILSTSLLVAIFSASSGFNAVIKGINKAYGIKETRSFIVVRLISIGLVILFALSIVMSLVLWIFSGNILRFIQKYIVLDTYLINLFSYVGTLGTLGLILLVVMFIYKVACCRKISFRSTLPGALVTVAIWVLSSKIFQMYVNNFSRYSKVYGSIAGVFVLMFWLNIISFVLLLGSEINALLDDNEDGTKEL